MFQERRAGRVNALSSQGVDTPRCRRHAFRRRRVLRLTAGGEEIVPRGSPILLLGAKGQLGRDARKAE